MVDLYEKMDQLNLNKVCMTAAVVEGDAFGQRALYEDGKMIWESEENGFFSQHEICKEEQAFTGIKAIEGNRIFCEEIGNEKKLVICGGGHISMPLIAMGQMLGFHVTVLEDRPKFADNARRAKADQVICDAFDKGIASIDSDKDTYFIIVTRGHRYDQLCLEEIIDKPNAYIGMIGSKLRVKKVIEYLEEMGKDSEKLAQVRTPIGLDIGAETPEEIAVAIMGEIIQIKNERMRNCGYSRKMLKQLLKEEPNRRVLATIVRRRGSAPREIGTKMLMSWDGSCFGTIGGGCVESNVASYARRMIQSNQTESELYTVDMSGKDAEEDGMVCGGTVDILLEMV